MESHASFSIDLLEDDADMPLNENDRAWIRQEIQAAHQKKGLGKLGAFLKDWIPSGAAITILIWLFTQYSAYTEFRVHANDRLDQIEAQLRVLQAPSAPRKVLSELASLPPKSLEKNLSALRSVVQQPNDQFVPIPETLQNVRRNLTHVDQDSPDYWPTALEFIAFASNSLAPNAPPRGTPPTVILKGDVFQGAAFPRSSVVLLDGGALTNERFEDSRIIFTNTPVILRNVTFINCAFEFPTITNEPPRFMKEAGRDLLASNLQNSYIPGV
jgi:hypothetical protein